MAPRFHPPTPSPTAAERAALGAVLVLGAAGIALGAAELARGGELTEDGWTERLSALGYLAVLPLVWLRRDTLARPVTLALALGAMCARELDLDKRFTEPGLLQARLYTGDAPLWLKLVGLAVVGALVVVLWRLAVPGLARWARAAARGAGWAWALAGAGALVLVSKSLDGLQRRLAPLGIDVPDAANALASRSEELLEVLIPAALALAIALVPSAPHERDARRDPPSDR
ncbi:MAG: hypothetical protein ACU0BS_02880 [Hasllibacter sp.]